MGTCAYELGGLRICWKLSMTVEQLLGTCGTQLRGQKRVIAAPPLIYLFMHLKFKILFIFFLIKLNLKKSTTNLFHFSLFSTISFEEVPFLIRQTCCETGFLFFFSGRVLKLYMDGKPWFDEINDTIDNINMHDKKLY